MWEERRRFEKQVIYEHRGFKAEGVKRIFLQARPEELFVVLFIGFGRGLVDGPVPSDSSKVAT